MRLWRRVLRAKYPLSRVAIAAIDQHGTASAPSRNIQYPKLEHLEIADFNITIHDFISFLTRSAPPLALFSIPDLELFYSNPADEADDDSTPIRTFLEVLGAAENFLPNLRNITLWACFSAREDYMAPICALTARRALAHAPLQSFRLIFPLDEADTALDGDIIGVAAVRRGRNGDLCRALEPQLRLNMKSIHLQRVLLLFNSYAGALIH
ncbi:hypothetical protein DFH08DRAFT_1081869 [Mycena albidolilacea]|uniref:Uncharacterized protein n=1 Tax=Mycena albidolilacea TaxID=1033008 RepID=A0AAD6ZWF2_9AGAR|nr:hypothetical protein DFH08DRAFT_1081869 [Mycena albidolilacea]